MKKLIIGLTLILGIAGSAIAYNAICPYDDGSASFLGYETVGNKMMAKYECLLSDHVFYVKA